MEIESLEGKMERQTRLIASAFGVEKWEQEDADIAQNYWGNNARLVPIRWSIDKDCALLNRVGVGQESDEAWLAIDNTNHYADFRIGSPEYNRTLVHGLYCFAFDSDELWREFGVSLSMHEKIELRLSMPREFWPQMWFEGLE
ncbi:hypothetical protein EON83_12705 [bacterium]|nr:MAG: hypothetical protein EON83_12705 [bacterium]